MTLRTYAVDDYPLNFISCLYVHAISNHRELVASKPSRNPFGAIDMRSNTEWLSRTKTFHWMSLLIWSLSGELWAFVLALSASLTAILIFAGLMSLFHYWRWAETNGIWNVHYRRRVKRSKRQIKQWLDPGAAARDGVGRDQEDVITMEGWHLLGTVISGQPGTIGQGTGRYARQSGINTIETQWKLWRVGGGWIRWGEGTGLVCCWVVFYFSKNHCRFGS